MAFSDWTSTELIGNAKCQTMILLYESMQKKDLPALRLGVLDSRLKELSVSGHLDGGKAIGIQYISKCLAEA